MQGSGGRSRPPVGSRGKERPQKLKVFSVCHHKKTAFGAWKSDICKSASYMFRPGIYLVILKIALKMSFWCSKNKILAKVPNHLTATVSWDTSVKKYIYIFWYSSKIYSGTGTAYFSTYQQQPKDNHSASKLRRIGILVPRSWELLKEKKRKYLMGSVGMLPWKILKVETKICAVWGILEGNLKKSNTLKLIMNISFLNSISIHRSITLIFIGKKVCFSIFFQRKIFFHDFHFRENPPFRDKTGNNQNNMK